LLPAGDSLWIWYQNPGLLRSSTVSGWHCNWSTRSWRL